MADVDIIEEAAEEVAVLDIIKGILNEKLDIPEEAVTEDATFDSLEIDSLDLVELICELEDQLDIDFGEPEGLETIGDVVEYIGTL